MYPLDAPTHFIMSPEDTILLIGHPNSQDDRDVTDGTNWVHIYNYKHPRAFSMRDDAPGATASLVAFVMASKR